MKIVKGKNVRIERDRGVLTEETLEAGVNAILDYREVDLQKLASGKKERWINTTLGTPTSVAPTITHNTIAMLINGDMIVCDAYKQHQEHEYDDTAMLMDDTGKAFVRVVTTAQITACISRDSYDNLQQAYIRRDLVTVAYKGTIAVGWMLSLNASYKSSRGVDVQISMRMK